MSRVLRRRRILPRPTLELTLPDALLSVLQGETVTFAVTVTRPSMALPTPSVSVSALPAGVTASVGAPVDANRLATTYQITLNASAGAPPINAASFVVTATSGAAERSRPASLTVVQAEPAPGAQFVISVSGPAILPRSDSVDIPVSLVRASGYTPSVGFTIDETLPAGVTAAFVPSATTGLFSVLTLTATAGAPTGPISLTVRAVGAGSADSVVTLTVTVVAAGEFAYLAPLYTLAQPLDGEGITFNPDTGMLSGSIIATPWLNRAWLQANADTVVTVKPTGGDFTGAQMQTVVDQAAARNDFTVVVVDSSYDVAAIELRYKAPTYEAANHTVFVCSHFWDGTWQPSGRRYVRTSGPTSERDHLFVIKSKLTAPRAALRYRQNERNQHKYWFIGCEVQRNLDPSQRNDPGADPSSSRSGFYLVEALFPSSPSIAGDQRPRGLGLCWSWVNGGSPAPDGWSIANGIGFGCEALVLDHSLVTGIARFQTETKGLLINIGARWVQGKSCLIEAHSISVLSGGSPYNNPDFTPADVWFDGLALPKRQTWNPSSPTYNGIGAQNKQLFEIKSGRRFTLQGIDGINSWQGAHNGSGLTIQNTVQSEAFPGKLAITEDITVRHSRLRNCVQPFGVLPGNVPPDNVPDRDPCIRIDVKNVLATRGKNAQLNYGIGSFQMMSMVAASGEPSAPRIQLFGPVDIQYVTWIAPRDESFVSAWIRLMSPRSDLTKARDTELRLRNCIFPHRANTTFGFITENVGTVYTPQYSGPGALLAQTLGGRGSIDFGKNILFDNASGSRRPQYETTFPEQYAAEYWRANLDDCGFESVTDDPLTGNWRLRSDSPLKGLGDAGRDPGCNHDLIDAAVGSLLADVPGYLPIAFPEAP